MTKEVEKFLRRLDEMSSTGNGIGAATVKKIRSFAKKEGFLKKKGGRP